MCKKKENKPKKVNWKAWIIGCGIVALLMPCAVCGLMQLKYKPISWIDGTVWLGFWGNYLGGLLGSSAALIVLYITQSQSDEQQRLSVMPALSMNHKPLSLDEVKERLKETTMQIILEPESERLFYETDPETFERSCPSLGPHRLCCGTFLEITNCGAGPALNVKLSYNNKEIMISGVKDGSAYPVMFLFIHNSTATEPNEPKIDILFTDLLGNEYKQSQKVVVLESEIDYRPATAPVLISEAH